MPIDLVIDERDGGKSDGEDFVGSSGNNVDQVTRRRLLQTQLLAVIDYRQCDQKPSKQFIRREFVPSANTEEPASQQNSFSDQEG